MWDTINERAKKQFQQIEELKAKGLSGSSASRHVGMSYSYYQQLKKRSELIKALDAKLKK